MSYEALPLDILPGIFKEASEYAAQGRYVDGNNVRFWKGFPERIGGNTAVTTEAVFRPARGVMAWRTLNGTQMIAFGHARGVQVLQGGTLYDVSPTGTDGYAALTVAVGAITGGPYQSGETVTTPNGAVGQLIQASVASPLYVSGDNGTLKLELSGISGSFATGEMVTATGGGTARVIIGGSSSPIHVYDNTGTFTGALTGSNSGATGTITSATVLWTGTLTGGTSGATSTIVSLTETHATDSGTTTAWGESTWGSSVWGGTESLYSSVSDAETWSFATWGEDLFACPRGGKIYHLDSSSFVADVATNFIAIPGVPLTALGIVMSDANRTLIAYGAHDGSISDPLNIRWCDEENYSVWTASASNTAGSIRCENGSLIRGMMRARGAYLVSTDTSIYLFRYVGLPFVYSLNQIASGSTLLGPNAWAEQDGITYWMGENGFYQYDGSVLPLPCDVHAYVFGRINAVQSYKVFCGTVRAYNEVWWFYVSTDATEIDSYVAYNTIEKTWHVGSKSRTSWIDTSVVFSYPTGTKPDGTIHAEELGTTDDGDAFSYSLETSDVEVNDGTAFLHNRMLIPDYDRLSGTHSVSIQCRGWPARSPTTKGPFSITSATEKISVRARGAKLRFSFAGNDDFRMGRWRYRVTGHGRKE